MTSAVFPRGMTWGLLVLVAWLSACPEMAMSQDGRCEGFAQLEYVKPYDKAQEELLVKEYWGDREDVDVVFAQRGNCGQYKGCTLADSTSLALCQVFSAVYYCNRGDYDVDSQNPQNLDWPTLLFTNCTGTRCELVLDPPATRCMYGTWRESDPMAKAKGTCVAEAGDTLLAERPVNFLRLLNASHCLLPLPDTSVLMKQIVCRDPGNEPWMRWWFDFARPFSDEPYSCIVQSRCQNIDDPLDFLCVTGADGEDILKQANEDAKRTKMFGLLDSAGSENHATRNNLMFIGFFFSSFMFWLLLSV